jgi:hypothetical protein
VSSLDQVRRTISEAVRCGQRLFCLICTSGEQGIPNPSSGIG